MVVGWRSVPCDDDHELPSLCKVLHGLSFSFCFVLHFCVVVLARHKFATSLCEQRGCTIDGNYSLVITPAKVVITITPFFG